MKIDPETDLQIERLIHAAPETIWRCWEEPELFKQWFTPPTVEVAEVDHDMRPGGRSFVVMKLPDGTLMPMEGCFLFVDRPKRLIYGDAMHAGYRPAENPFMTAIVDLIPKDDGTLYRATVLHATSAQRAQHEEMGFQEGWGTTFEQLDRLASSL